MKLAQSQIKKELVTETETQKLVFITTHNLLAWSLLNFFNNSKKDKACVKRNDKTHLNIFQAN